MNKHRLTCLEGRLAFEKLCDLNYTPLMVKTHSLLNFDSLANSVINETGMPSDNVYICTFHLTYLKQINCIVVPASLSALFILASSHLGPSSIRKYSDETGNYSVFLRRLFSANGFNPWELH